MLKKLILYTLLMQGASAIGQTEIAVKLPATGDFAVFTGHGVPTEPPSSPTESKGGALNVVSAASDDTISVWDKTSGNIGSKAISQTKAGWAVEPKDLNRIAQVKIHVVHDGNSVASGEVTLNDGSKRDPELLDTKSAGDALFFDVKPGLVPVSVKVKGDQGGMNTVTQMAQLPLERTSPISITPIAIAQDVDTVANSASAQKRSGTQDAAAPAGAAKPENAPSAIGQILTYLIGIGIAAGVIYGIVAYFKKSPGTVSEKLEQLGVQIPKPDDQGAYSGPAGPIDLPKPEPPQKIMLDDAAPTPLSPSFSSLAQLSAVAQEPTLLSTAGVPIPVMDGESVVGRDPGLGLSLTGESTVSRKHATIVRQGSSVTVTDLGSTNGTFINGARIQSPVILRPGDSVQFGSVAFRYQG